MRYIVQKPLMHLGVHFQIGASINLDPDHALTLGDAVARIDFNANAEIDPIGALTGADPIGDPMGDLAEGFLSAGESAAELLEQRNPPGESDEQGEMPNESSDPPAATPGTGDQAKGDETPATDTKKSKK